MLHCWACMPTTAVTTALRRWWVWNNALYKLPHSSGKYVIKQEKWLKASNFNVSANWEYIAVTRLQRRNKTTQPVVDCVWNVMAQAQKPDFVFRRNGRVPFQSVGASVQWTTGSRGARINESNAGYTMFRRSVKSTGYPLHSPVSPLLPLLCVTVCHHISTGP